MTNRAIFNRSYTEFTPGTTPVWLVNGGSITSSPPSSFFDFTAGADLIQGEVVYVSGVFALPATAAAGATQEETQAVGITTAAATAGSTVPVNLDDVVQISAANITAETNLVPGQYYYLSKFSGQLTRYTTASGSITAPDGYSALVNLGLALSPNQLSLEIQPPAEIFS